MLISYYILKLKVVPVQVVDYIRVFVFPHHKDLVNNELFLWLLLQIHLFDCHLNKVKRTEVSNEKDAYFINVDAFLKLKHHLVYLLSCGNVDSCVYCTRCPENTAKKQGKTC